MDKRVFPVVVRAAFIIPDRLPEIYVSMPNIEIDNVTVWNKEEISLIEWNAIVNNLHCANCGGEVKSMQAQFTSVKPKGIGAYRIVCADCILKAAESDEKLADLLQNSDTAIQPGKQIVPVTIPTIN
jgi:hypothetical protein